MFCGIQNASASIKASALGDGAADLQGFRANYYLPDERRMSVMAHDYTWRDRRTALEAAQQAVAGADVACRTRLLRKPFVGWRAAAHRMRWQADTLKLCVARLRYRQAALAFHSWRAVAAERRHQRGVVEGSLRRITHRSPTGLLSREALTHEMPVQSSTWLDIHEAAYKQQWPSSFSSSCTCLL